ncbi:MAG: MlaD family protein [Bacteroidetes bacterium]|nr:MlaD family protein [Bacteroidota bacterium]
MFYKKFSEIKVGVFVFIAVIIVASTVFWAKGFMFGKDKMDLVVYFSAVSGLNYADPVAVNGVIKGKVMKIELEGDSVKVTFAVDRDIKIKTDYKIEISSPELMSGKMIYIKPGKEGTEIDYKNPLKGTNGSDIASMMSTVSDLSVDVKTLIGKFSKTADNLDKVLVNVNELVGDKRMQNDLKSTISNLSVTSKNLNGLVSESRTSIRSITEGADKTMNSVNNMLDDNSPEIKNTIKDIRTLTAKFDSLTTNLNLIVSDIQTQKSGVGKFIYDDKFFNNLNKTLEEVEKLTKKIREDGIKINLF